MQTRHGVCAVVPAYNAANSIGNVISQLYRAGIRSYVVVANGCIDSTVFTAHTKLSALLARHRVVEFPTALGPDVPRAVGAFTALREFRDSTHLLFVDGDWQGGFGPMLSDWLEPALRGRCEVQYTGWRNEIAMESRPESLKKPARLDEQIWTAALQREFPDLQWACPSAVPLLVQRQTFEKVSAFWMYQPGMWFAKTLCATRGYPKTVAVNGDWNAVLTGNPSRSAQHMRKMEETLLGDALEGVRLLQGKKPSRKWRGILQDGYHSERRVDVLKAWQASLRVDFGRI
ncbi:hypothetical protein LLE49_16330 [Alicyclobacillus tolerans]|uniref:hypothetical protein n=1 Tax=Alicyclobacillus tolerans TaxID=90970 RepID=UPI001F41014A|nr:hypothetical protein [Alicyclobacillus tolerans]MCF8566289.1 hypothetical protein [Alicyclobacillus tolerans]